MRHGLVVANWKMHGRKAEVEALLRSLVRGLALTEGVSCEVVVCPPALFLGQSESLLSASSLKLGAQNVFTGDQGAYTGEVSASMVAEFACRYVIVGHSERRQIFGEDNALVAAKFAAVQQAGLTPILCVGESREQREAGETTALILEQLNAVLDEVGIAAFANAVIAYEPVWAIGTGLSASPEQAQEVHRAIRAALGERKQAIADEIKILYGGSVKASNAASLFAQEDIDGALVGGASLNAGEFVSICRSLGL